LWFYIKEKEKTSAKKHEKHTKTNQLLPGVFCGAGEESWVSAGAGAVGGLGASADPFDRENKRFNRVSPPSASSAAL
jgi:hypothetical protein